MAMTQRSSPGRLRGWVPVWTYGPAVAACTLFSDTVLAQKEVKMEDESGGGVLPWAIALGVIVLVCGSAFLNPKRSHHG